MAPAAVAPRRRLDSLSRPALRAPRPPQPPAAQADACCEDPKIEDEDGAKVCKTCFTQISESNIVSDVTFQEDSRGAAAVQGAYISENARHARTLGPSAYRRVGGGEKNTTAETEQSGRRALNALSPRLGIPDTISQQASFIWNLAHGIHFTAGRKTDEVIAACLYAACRRQKENTVLLMDISELLRINVFRLGEVYKDLVKELYLSDSGNVGFQQLVEVEPLILKYCRKLEFGEATKQVAEDAIKIIRRMKRDWMVTGRHPAGLCGACIILAARMNNFRRTVREIVYISKVADVTVAKRVEEFRRTNSAALTIDQFRLIGNRLKFQHDPPILHYSKVKQQKFEAKQRRRQQQGEQQEPIEIPDDSSSRASSKEPTPPPTQRPETEKDAGSELQRAPIGQAIPAPIQQEPRFDADGFAIPALPVDPAITDQPASQKRKRGRRRKDERPPQLSVSEEELVGERELEEYIEEVLDDPQIVGARNEIEEAKAVERAKLLAEQQRAIAVQKNDARREAQGMNWYKDKVPAIGEDVTEADLEAEFADDSEVLNCLLTPQEAAEKEKIWVAYNEDWLRSQHEKELIKKIAAAAGGGEKLKRGAKGKKKRSKMGDGTLLAEAGTPIETPADANAAMLAKRAPQGFSRYVNYEALGRVYGASPSTSASRASSEVPSQTGSLSRNGTPSAAGAAASERISASPVLASRGGSGLRSPPDTQQIGAAMQSSATPGTSRAPVPASPPATQAQVVSGAVNEAEPAAEDEDEDMDDEDDENEYHSDQGTPPADYFDDGREDIGEDDYNCALDSMGGAALDGSFGGDDDYY